MHVYSNEIESMEFKNLCAKKRTPEPMEQETLSQSEPEPGPNNSSNSSTTMGSSTTTESSTTRESSTTMGKEQFNSLFDFRQQPVRETVTKPKAKARPKPNSGQKVCDKVTSKASPLRSKSKKRKSDDGDIDGSIAKRLLRGYDEFWERNGIGTSNTPSQ